ncbi:MAG: glycosyltransferase [Pseudanabaenaceae cyanobacterium]
MTFDLLPVPAGSLVVPKLTIESSIVLSLVIPTFNESKNIQPLVKLLTDLLDKPLAGRYELIVVDDNSPDRTWEIAHSLQSVYPHLRVMRREQERGLATAIIRGWQVAKGDILGVIDGDLQHPPDILLKLLSAMDRETDLAVASRHIPGGGVSDWGLIRRFLSRGAQLLGLIILPRVVGRVSDPMSGYFLIRRSAIADCGLDPVGYKILLEVLGRGNIRTIKEVGYVFQERQAGESKVTSKQYIEYIQHLLRLRFKGRLTKLKQQIPVPIRRFIKFGIVGFTGVFVDMAIFYLLSDPSKLGWGITRSKIIAAEVSIISNFILNDLWTFGDLAQQQRGWSARLKRFLKFNLICASGLFLNVVLLNMLVNYFSLNRYLANLLAILTVSIWNFWINLKLSWRVTVPETED